MDPHLGQPDQLGQPDHAACATHPAARAVGACERCGNYICLECQTDGRDVCPACRDHVPRFGFTRESYTLGALLSHAWERFEQNWKELVVGALLFFGITILVGVPRGVLDVLLADEYVLRLGLALPLQLVETIIGGVIGLGFIAMCLQVLEGKPAQPSLVVSMWHKTGTLIVLYLIFAVAALVLLVPLFVLLYLVISSSSYDGAIVVVTLVFIALLAVPGIYVGLGTFFATFEIAHDDVDAIEALRRSWHLASGHRWPILGALVIGVGIMVAGVLACGVGLLAARPLATLLYGGLFLALRNSSVPLDRPRPPELDVRVHLPGP